MKPATDKPHFRKRPLYREIASTIRSQISAGTLAPGTRLPSTVDLAKEWESNYFTVHTALSCLVKEGFLARLHGRGTYVADFKSRFTCAGIYYGEDIWLNEESAFYRSLHSALQSRFARLDKKTLIFVDSRPPHKQKKALPSLAEAVRQREIQCLICPLHNKWEFPALSNFSLPTAFFTGETPNRVLYQPQLFIEEGLRRLAAQGCHSVGLISNISPDENEVGRPFYESFYQGSKAEGMIIRKNWIYAPPASTPQIAEYGYDSFRKLWSLPEKPEGLIVCYDSVMRGVITAILEARVRVPEQLKIVSHRNSHVNLLCPFPVTWGATSEDFIAEAMIRQIELQFKGEKTAPIPVPFTFEDPAEVVRMFRSPTTS